MKKADTKHILRKVFRIFLYVFAFIGFIFAFVYIGMQLGLFNVKGSISIRNSYFDRGEAMDSGSRDRSNLKIICEINTLSSYAPLTSVNIYKTLAQSGDIALAEHMITVASERFNTDVFFTMKMDNCVNANRNEAINLPISAFNWVDTDEWNLMKIVFTRDQEIIRKAAEDAGISPRLILSGVIGEQFRFFNSRESFKSYFEPLKILASLSNISYGIAGLKPKTVSQIEEHLKDRSSPFYLGPAMEHVADYDPNIVDSEAEQLNRITDTKNPYYSYFYVGLYMKQIEAQWRKAGYPIDNRPEVLSTLYNLGFYYSVPKSDPKTGGTTIHINNVDYTFGDLGYQFYYSGELSDIFPLAVQ